MAIIPGETKIKDTLWAVAERMILAAETAPKGRGDNNLRMAVVEGEDIRQIASTLKEMGEKHGVAAFGRDADTILSAPIMIIIGSRIKSLGLKKCGMCGFEGCQEKDQHPNVPCAFNTGDLGIAIGSMVCLAMDHRVDNRIMYTVGQAVIEMELLGKDVKIAYGIPLSATAKNPFFDRK